MADFNGFPIAAFDFYDDLELDNTKSFWDAHKNVYLEAVLTPMKDLTAELEAEFGPAKIFRPRRDVRFSADKSPYKTAQGAFISDSPGSGWYIQISAAGVFVAAGFHGGTPAQIAALRRGIDDDDRGTQLQRLTETAVRDGLALGGETLKTAPRGFDVTHPRIGLLRHKSLTLAKQYGFDPMIQTPQLLAAVRSDWRQMRPLVEWLTSEFARDS